MPLLDGWLLRTGRYNAHVRWIASKDRIIQCIDAIVRWMVSKNKMIWCIDVIAMWMAPNLLKLNAKPRRNLCGAVPCIDCMSLTTSFLFYRMLHLLETSVPSSALMLKDHVNHLVRLWTACYIKLAITLLYNNFMGSNYSVGWRGGNRWCFPVSGPRLHGSNRWFWRLYYWDGMAVADGDSRKLLGCPGGLRSPKGLKKTCK